MPEKEVIWPEYERSGFGPGHMLATAAWGIFGAIAIPLLADRAPDLVGPFCLAFVAVLAVFFYAPTFIVGRRNLRIRAAWENGIGARLEPDEARALIAASPAAYRLHYRSFPSRFYTFGSVRTIGGYDSFVLEEKATGRRWVVRFQHAYQGGLGIGQLWELAGAQIELKRFG